MGKPYERRVPADIGQAQRLRIADEDAEDAAAARKVADRAVRRLVHPRREEPVELPATLVEDAERRVAGAGQLAGGLDHALQHRFVIELGDHFAPDLEQSPEHVGAELRWRVPRI